ncbi:MAG: hypothetical protein WKG07_49050 [Hymenobacter sp.]
METLQGYPYFPIEFTKDGRVANPAQVATLLAGLRAAAPTDLLVLSHGWNNDMAEAKLLYDKLMAQFKLVLAGPTGPALAGAHFAVLGVLRPSKKFADANLIPSGAAGVGARPLPRPCWPPPSTNCTAPSTSRGPTRPLDAAKKLLPVLEDQPTAQTEFARLLRSRWCRRSKPRPMWTRAMISSPCPGQQLLAQLGKPLPAAVLAGPAPPAPPGEGRAAGSRPG